MTEQQKPNRLAEDIQPSLSALVLSLTATALAYLGNPINPGADNPAPDYPLALYTIDTIQMLKEKTEGNRTTEETELFNDILTQLRMIYIQKTRPEL
jgi:hypothetical protein|uniref:DUF1844 domain-containing protein n=1 Tax=candidate division WOR-3 bacterium TaxID=2052148 RepID=A0A7V3PTE4_UNCW3